MTDGATPPPPPPWRAPEQPRRRGFVGWFFTVSGAIVLIVTLSSAAVAMLFAGCVSVVDGNFHLFYQVVGAVIGLIFLGLLFLWLGRARPQR